MSEQSKCPKCGTSRHHNAYLCGSWLNRGNNDAFVQSDRCRVRELEQKVAGLESANKKLALFASMALDVPMGKNADCVFIDGVGEVPIEEYFAEWHEPPEEMRKRLVGKIRGLEAANELYRKGMESQCELMDGLKQRVRELQAFKDWVHNYLDVHEVPHHPPGSHGAAGCRIGDRMDWLMGAMASLKTRNTHLKSACDLFEKNSADAVQLWELLREIHIIRDTVYKSNDGA